MKGDIERLLLVRPQGDPANGVWIGRLPRQAPEVDGCTRIRNLPTGVKPGDFIRVQLTGGRGYDLTARPV